MVKFLNSILSQLALRQDLIFLAFVFVFILMFIIPVPPSVVDLLIVINIALTLIVMIASTYLKGPTDLSTFPAIILFTTIFRLAITVASARLILAHADAGEVIRTFGNFVIGGKLIVGLIVFLIVAVVQFIVVVKGTERISEVSARFTLDAMPGKQMSIDSDLRNGDITKEEARARRSKLEKESQFFGAMDGAIRFVKGDAIAGFIVIFVNLLGGILVGMLTRGMGFSEAARTYSLLSVGEGLVAQIPAMLVAMSAGIVATRITGDKSTSLGADMASELASNKRSLVIAGVVLILLGFMPGFPTMIFGSVAVVLIGAAYLLSPGGVFVDPTPVVVEPEPLEPEAKVVSAPAIEPFPIAESGDIFQIAVPPELAADLNQAGIAPLWSARCDAIERDMGFKIARAAMRIDDRIPPNTYRLEIEDVPAFEDSWNPDRYTLMLSPAQAEQAGLANSLENHPVLGSVAVCDATEIPGGVSPDRILDASQRFVQLLETGVRRHASASFGISEAMTWLEQLHAKYPHLVTQAQQSVPNLRLVEICRRLLDEGVSLSPPHAMLEALIRNQNPNLDSAQVAEDVRKTLRRQIVHSVMRGSSQVPALLLEPNVESRLTAILRMSPADMESQRASSDLSGLTFARTVGAAARDAQEPGVSPVLVTTSRVRQIAQTMLRRHGVQIPVISLEEVGTETPIRPLRALNINELGLA